MEKKHITELFINGRDLQIENIFPRIHICDTPSDFEIYNYCRFLQSVPNTNRVGRQIKALVYDDGQRRPVLIGAIGLASSMYTVGCRDRYLNWVGKEGKFRKDIGLRRLMDLAVCIAFQPYSFLLGGKLMALLAMTDPFRIEFQRRYGMPLLGLVTTCATGVHCPIFNRIMIRKGGLYRHIGETAGYTTVIFSADTLRAGRRLVENLKNAGNNQLSFSSKPIRILRQALKLCSIPYEPLLHLGNPKGVYIAVLSEDSLVCLRAGKCSDTKDSLSVKDAFEYWKTDILPKRRHCQETIEKISRFRREKLALSRNLH